MLRLRSSRSIGFVLAALGAGAAASGWASPGGPAPSEASPEPRTKIALTFDDLPVHGALPPGKTRLDIAASILETLRTWHAPPTYGFVNAKALDEGAENLRVLEAWRRAGHPLANHTFTHMDLHANSVEAFERDVVANESVLRTSMEGQEWRWLRYPYLREGNTLEKRHAVRSMLKERGYRIAEVTMSFDDYAYNDPYARCLAKNDTQALELLQQSYLDRASESLSVARQEARSIYDRDINHVMLLHVGGFQMVMLPRLMDLLQRRGFELVTLGEAQSDPAYAIDPDVASEGGATLLDQMRAARGIAPAPSADPPFAQLAALCR